MEVNMKGLNSSSASNVAEGSSPQSQAQEPSDIDKGSPPSIWKVLGLARDEQCVMLSAFLLQVLAELGELAIPLLLSEAYDVVVEDLKNGKSVESVRNDIAKFMVAVLVLHSVSMLLAFIRGLLMGVSGERVVARLRNRLFAHLLAQEMGFFDEKKSGELVSRLGSDTMLVQVGTTQALTDAAIGLIKAIVSVALMFSISWKLTVIVFAVCIALLLFSVPLSQWVGRITTAYQDALSKAAVVSTEALGAMRTLRSFDCEELEKSRYEQHIGSPSGAWWPAKQETTLYHGVRKAYAMSMAFSIGFFIGLGALYGSLWYGFVLYTEGQITIGGLSAFQSYIFQIGFALAALGQHSAQIFEALGGARRIFELLEHEPEDDTQKSGDVQPSDMRGEVAFVDVDFAYPSRPEKQVLAKFSLHVPAQRVAAIVGSSGSGKSTVFALLSRFYQAQGGQVLVDGVSVADVDLRWLRRHMALVQQEPVLFGMSIWDNVCYGRKHDPPSEAEVEEACKQANALQFIASLPEQFQTLVGERGIKLSGGQKQRIAIARALIMAPRILLLDEATSALDAESERQVQEAIDRTMAGRTVLVVAHRLSTVRNAHQIAVAQNGAVVDVGVHQELLARCQVYQTLVKRQTDGQ